MAEVVTSNIPVPTIIVENPYSYVTLEQTGSPGPKGDTGETGPQGPQGTTDVASATSVSQPGYYPNASYPTARTYNTVVGNNDLYTVPTGRKALVYGLYNTNFTGGTIGYYPAAKIGGTYYQMGAYYFDGNTGTTHRYNFAGNLSLSTVPILLYAGETFAANCETAGVTIWAVVIEFDDSSALNRASLTSFVAGDNTVFTVPAGKSAQVGSIGYDGNDSARPTITGYGFFNASGAARTITCYAVPAGGSKSNSNKSNDPGAVGNNVFQGKSVPMNMGPGDSVVLNASSAAAGQFFWFNYLLGRA